MYSINMNLLLNVKIERKKNNKENVSTLTRKR